ncbi:MAG: DNA translocase FtsK [bacterium]
MALKTKQKTSTVNDSPFVVSPDKKKKIVGLFLLILSILIFFSVLSYHRSDVANLTNWLDDFIASFSPDLEFAHRQQNTYNWLGIFGAYTSNFLINSTIGYSCVILPVMLFLWGYSIIINEKRKLALFLSNFLISMGILTASLMGLMRFKFGIFSEKKELAGKIGDFFGETVGFLLGGLGGLIFIVFIIFLVLFIAFDLDLAKIAGFFKMIWRSLIDDESPKGEAEIIDENGDNEDLKKTDSKKQDDGKKLEETKDNLEKIKELRTNKTKAKLKGLSEALNEDEEEEDTRIEIVRKKELDKEIELENKNKVNKTKDDQKLSKKDENKEDNKSETKITVDKTISVSANKEDKEYRDLPVVDLTKEILKEKKLPEQWEENLDFKPIPITTFTTYPNDGANISDEELHRNAELLTEKLSLFDIKIEDIKVHPGPVVTMYEIVPSPGVKISRIVNLENDIALALAARGIRIIAPIPGKSAIGVEIPNAKASMVSARSVLEKIRDFGGNLPLALGKEISGDIYITDLAAIPHLLVAGSTGSGKSVGINMMIMSLIYSKHPSEIKFVIIDPKKIELSFYKKMAKHYLAVSPDLDEEIITTPSNSLIILKAAVLEMENRYDMLSKAGVRNITEYNKKLSDPKKRPADTEKIKHHKLPYIVIIIDELADLMITSGKEVEEPITRIAQLARAVGIHLIVATQRPSVNVITGIIKANFSARIAYQVASKIDSRTILDMNGAEQLLGKGDMLFLPAGMPKPVRIQNAFVSTDEVEDATDYVAAQKGFSKRYYLPSVVNGKSNTGGSVLSDLDAMFEDAALCVLKSNQASVSYLQRKLKLGYARAARIMDQLEDAGIVGPADGSKMRLVLIESEEQLDAIMRSI